MQNLFCEVVPGIKHRCQLLHHAAVLRLPRILYVAATVNSIEFIADVNFHWSAINEYIRTLTRIRLQHDPRTMEEPKNYPKCDADVLGFTKENEDLQISLKISLDFARYVPTLSKPLPSTHYILPLLFCFWNMVGKIRTDTYSMFLSHAKLQISKLHPESAGKCVNCSIFLLQCFG